MKVTVDKNILGRAVVNSHSHPLLIIYSKKDFALSIFV